MESYEIGIRGIPCHQGLLIQDRLYHLQFYENQAIVIVFEEDEEACKSIYFGCHIKVNFLSYTQYTSFACAPRTNR